MFEREDPEETDSKEQSALAGAAASGSSTYKFKMFVFKHAYKLLSHFSLYLKLWLGQKN